MASGNVDPRIANLARASANFGFLVEHLDLLVLYGAGAENLIFTDPNGAMVKSRQFGEALAGDLVRRFRLRVDGDTQAKRLVELERAGVLHGNVRPAFDRVRTLGNQAVHHGYAEQRAAFDAVRTCFQLGVWFDRLLTGSREPRAWVPPQPPALGPSPVTEAERTALAQLNEDFQRVADQLAETKLTYRDAQNEAEAQQLAREQAEAALAQVRAEHARLTAMLAGLQDAADQPVAQAMNARPAVKVSSTERDRWLGQAQQAAREPLTEAQVRVELDRMLAAAGWSVQDNTPAVNLFAAQGVALREMSMARGRADYLLYVDQKLVGVIEAKREGEDVATALEQAERYVQNASAAQRMAAWKTPAEQTILPFRYSSDGGRTLFRNTLDPDSRSRQVFWFHRPETFALWMRQAEQDPQAPTLRGKMRIRMPALDESALWRAQVEAVHGVEKSNAQGKTRALIQMATGAGKTYTAATFCYRLAKHAEARRILFLVDRNNLGAQAKAEFDTYQISGTNRVFPEEYNVQRLATGQEMNDSTKVVVSTIQRLWATLSGRPLDALDDDAEDEDVESGPPVEVQYNPAIPPETFDLIVIDECHRSIYGKWRQVLEYFDAHLIGLTATPVGQTFGFFRRNLVSEYTHEQAVADGVNVPFDVYRINTEITTNGGQIEAKTTVPKIDRRTRRQKYEELDEDFVYRAPAVGNNVMPTDQIRTVIGAFHERLYTEIFPERAAIPEDKRFVPKTLVFAKTDEHADRIVEAIKDEFGKGDDFCKKITHKAVKAHDLINEFRTNAQLRIAVTVDMIATGTDVKSLECLIFMRDVRSWAQFEQMKGRGTRVLSHAEIQRVTPDVESKTRFVIVDTVGVTEHVKIDAAPLEKEPEKRKSLEKLLTKAGNGEITPSEVSTLAARLAKLHQQIKPEERAELDALAGMPLTEITRAMVEAVSVDAQLQAEAEGGKQAVHDRARESVTPLASNPALRTRILEIRRATDIVIDEVSRDSLTHAAPVVLTQQDGMKTITDFKKYMRDNQDVITAFQVAFENPGLSPREVFLQLKEIARRLERPPLQWTTAKLWDAYEIAGIAVSKPGAKHGVTDLISIMRFELGLDEELRPYADAVGERFAGWLLRQEQAGNHLTDKQRWWLEKIAESIARDIRFDEANLDQSPFTQNGGTDGYLRDFGEADAVRYLHELNQELAA